MGWAGWVWVSSGICVAVPVIITVLGMRYASTPTTAHDWFPATCTTLATIEAPYCKRHQHGHVDCQDWGKQAVALRVSSPSFIPYYGTNSTQIADECGNQLNSYSKLHHSYQIGVDMPCWLAPLQTAANENAVTVALSSNCLGYDQNLVGALLALLFVVSLLCLTALARVVWVWRQHRGLVEEPLEEPLSSGASEVLTIQSRETDTVYDNLNFLKDEEPGAEIAVGHTIAPLGQRLARVSAYACKVYGFSRML